MRKKNKFSKKSKICDFGCGYGDYFNIINKFKDRLDKIVKVMNIDSEIKVNVISSTDCRGSKSYNTKLSISRTEIVLKYIKDRITDPNRITGIGIGEIQKDENKTLSYSNTSNSIRVSNSILYIF